MSTRYTTDKGASGQVPAVTSTGAINGALTVTFSLGARPTGTAGASMAQVGALTVTTGVSGRSMTVSQLAGSDAISTGSAGGSLAATDVGSGTTSLGFRGGSMSVSSSILGVGYVTTASTAGGVVWTNPTNVEADDAATAGWVLSEGIGAGAATTSTGTLTATTPHLGTTPAGFTRTKVETLVHRSDAAVGLGATGDTATFTVGLQDKTGAALQTVVSDTFTAAGSNANTVVATDVTTAVAAISDADLALTKFLLTATFARTLAATGTRSWTVAVDSLALRCTYTRSGIT